MNQNLPSRKVGAGALAGGVIAMAVWAANQFYGIEVSPEAAVGASTTFTFVLQYLIKDADA